MPPVRIFVKQNCNPNPPLVSNGQHLADPLPPQSSAFAVHPPPPSGG